LTLKFWVDKEMCNYVYHKYKVDANDQKSRELTITKFRDKNQ
jgi:hypothetical protein